MNILWIEHTDGIPWFKAPKPWPWFHRHSIQTRSLDARGFEIYRCACGALRYSDIPGWCERGTPRFRGLFK